jgi:hypothetical protein
MSAKEHNAAMFYKVMYHFTKNFSSQLRINYIFQSITNNYEAEIILNIPGGRKQNCTFMSLTSNALSLEHSRASVRSKLHVSGRSGSSRQASSE